MESLTTGMGRTDAFAALFQERRLLAQLVRTGTEQECAFRVGIEPFASRRRMMGWTAPERHQRAKMVVVKTPSEGKPSMGKFIRNLSTVTRVGLDLAKRVFQVHAVDAKGEIVVARRLTRGQLIPFFAELPPCVVAMEACSSAHHWGRALIELGHEVRLNCCRPRM